MSSWKCFATLLVFDVFPSIIVPTQTTNRSYNCSNIHVDTNVSIKTFLIGEKNAGLMWRERVVSEQLFNAMRKNCSVCVYVCVCIRANTALSRFDTGNGLN